MNGTMRVEKSYYRELRQIMPETLRLCRYQASRRRFVSIATLPSAGKTGNVARSAHRVHGGAPRLGRRIEQAVRAWRRSAAAGAFRLLDRLRGDHGSPFAEARTGDVLLLTGENWSRFDFAVLRLARQRSGMRVAAICQDLIPIKCPQFYEADGFIERIERYADFLVNDADLVIAISEKTRSDVLAYARGRGGLRGDIHTINLGHDVGAPAPAERPPALGMLEPKKFVLSVSTIQSRKNFDLLYHLWQRLSEEGLPDLPKLVIAGRKGFGSKDLLWQIAHDPAVRDCVVVRHDISDAALAWLYRECAFTLYPSFYEGWGLPVSEKSRSRQILHRLERTGAGRSGPGARHAHRSARFRGVEGGNRRAGALARTARGARTADQDELSRRHLAGVRSKPGCSLEKCVLTPKSRS